MNRALMAAGLVDLIQVSVFPVISGQSGDQPIFGGAADFDLDLIDHRTLDGRTQELITSVEFEERIEPFEHIATESRNDRRARLILPSTQRCANKPC